MGKLIEGIRYAIALEGVMPSISFPMDWEIKFLGTAASLISLSMGKLIEGVRCAIAPEGLPLRASYRR